LNPKWKGRIVIDDPRVDGPGSGRIALWTGQLGEEFVRTLLKQDLALTRDGRQLADWLARGKYPIAIGANDTEIGELQKLGIGLKVEPLAGKLAEAWRMGTGWGAIRLVNKAPHPKAAAVFINWLLSKEGQTGWATIGGRPSRRMDVPRITGLSPEPGVDYFDIDREERLQLRDKAKEIAKAVLQ
jgi:ABC-type Fe3+ transport system substrate-binding protein